MPSAHTQIQIRPARWAVEATLPASIHHLLSRIQLILDEHVGARDTSR